MPLPANLVNRLIEKVKSNVGRSGDSTLDDYCIEYINNAQKKILNRANFWFMHTTTTIPYTVGDNAELLPADFKNVDVVSIFVDNAWIKLEYIEWDDIRKTFQSSPNGRPTHWKDENANLVLYPVPDKSYDIQLDYYRYLADLVAGGASNAILDNYPEIIESWATSKAFWKLREFEDAKEWGGLFEQQLRELVVTNGDKIISGEIDVRARRGTYGSSIRSRGRRV